jgi:mevalonate kinase
MPSISASAPGKIILFGEHAVVYGTPAIAAPVVQVQAKAVVAPDPGQSSGSVRIIAPDINLEGPLKDLPIDHALSKAVDLTLNALGISKPPAFKIKVTSAIPLAAGLGSGAAVSVAIIRGVSEFLGHPLPDETVSQLAFEVEKIHHGTPSGIDNTVVTYARPVYFTKGQPIETFIVKKPFTIVIGDTGIAVPTSITVGDVRKRWETEPEKYNALFEKCGDIAVQARQAIEQGNNEKLGPLMNDNQTLLEEISVSSKELEGLIQAAMEAGALGAKLSGGGRGGNMIALVDDMNAEKVANALEEAGATNTIVTKVGN